MKIDSASVKQSSSVDESKVKTAKDVKKDEDSIAKKEFADELKEKIEKLEDQPEEAVIAEPLNKEPIEEVFIMQEFAGLFGKGLPQKESLVTDIDLENTLETLKNVVNKLDGVDKNKLNLLSNDDVEMLDLKSKGLTKAELLSKQNTAKLDQVNVALSPKQIVIDDLNRLTNLRELNEFNELGELGDLTKMKDVSKFTTDLNQLSRAVVGSETKTQPQLPPMTKHFANPEWNKELGERVVWMHKQAIPTASLRLNPQHLGPITIKVEVTQDQATIAFTAQNAAVKEALEASLPKLRELLSAQQLNLADVNVTQDNSQQKQSQAFAQMDSEERERKNKETADINGKEDNVLDIADEIEAGRAIASNGILSLFA